MYGTLYDWLDRRCNAIDPGPIRDLLREHIVEHDAVGAGETVLGIEITHRRYHSVESLAEVTGISRSRLGRLLQKMGRVPEGATEAECGRMRFDAEEITGFIADSETTIPLLDVPEYIGASKRQVEMLYAAEIVLPLVPRTGRGRCAMSSSRAGIWTSCCPPSVNCRKLGRPMVPLLRSATLAREDLGRRRMSCGRS